MEITWVLVANASTAKLYSLPESKLKGSNANLKLVKALEHPESKVKDKDQVSDRLGHFGHGDFVEETEPKEHEADKFARECSDLLNEGRINHVYKSVVIVAPPTFYGLLGKHLNKHVTGLVIKTLNSDYTKISEDELIGHLNEAFELK